MQSINIELKDTDFNVFMQTISWLGSGDENLGKFRNGETIPQRLTRSKKDLDKLNRQSASDAQGTHITDLRRSTRIKEVLKQQRMQSTPEAQGTYTTEATTN